MKKYLIVISILALSCSHTEKGKKVILPETKGDTLCLSYRLNNKDSIQLVKFCNIRFSDSISWILAGKYSNRELANEVNFTSDDDGQAFEFNYINKNIAVIEVYYESLTDVDFHGFITRFLNDTLFLGMKAINMEKHEIAKGSYYKAVYNVYVPDRFVNKIIFTMKKKSA